MVQHVKPPPAVPASHGAPVRVIVALLPIQLPGNMLKKVAEEGPSTWALHPAFQINKSWEKKKKKKKQTIKKSLD